MTDNLKLCPCCGALPIDWEGDPFNAACLAQELVEALSNAVAHLRPMAGECERNAYKQGHAALAKVRGEA